MVTIYNIQDLELFFDSINDFENPVTIQRIRADLFKCRRK